MVSLASVPTPSEVMHHPFANGLVLVAERMPGVRSAAFSFLVPSGVAFEPEEAAGTASLLSEWIARGAGERDSRNLIGALDDLGVSHSESAHTAHTGVSAATLGTNLIPALELIADILLRPHLDDEEFEPIRALALQSLQSLDDDPGSKVMIELRRRSWPAPWGRPTPGTPEGVRAATPEIVREHFERTYRPNGAILGVAGAIDWPALVDAVGRLFGEWEPRPDPVFQIRPAGPDRDHIVKETHQTQIALAFPSVPLTHPDYYAARASAAILGGYASARLFTEVREKRGLCYAVSAGYEGLRDRASVLCYAGTSSDRAQETLDVTLGEIRRLKRDGVDGAELDMMRAGLKSSLIMQQESSMSRSSSLAADWYHLGRVRPLEEVAGALDRLTPEQVSAHAARTPLADLTILTLGPKPLEVPALAHEIES